VDAGARQVTINHEDIPGLMPAMTMTFAVRSPSVLADVTAGSRVRFDLVKEGELLVVTWLVPLGRASGGRPGIHDHTPHHGGVVGMVGLLHLEAVAARDGLVRVYLTDVWRRPLPLAGVQGRVTIGLPGASSELALVAGEDALEAKGPPLERGGGRGRRPPRAGRSADRIPCLAPGRHLRPRVGRPGPRLGRHPGKRGALGPRRAPARALKEALLHVVLPDRDEHLVLGALAAGDRAGVAHAVVRARYRVAVSVGPAGRGWIHLPGDALHRIAEGERRGVRRHVRRPRDEGRVRRDAGRAEDLRDVEDAVDDVPAVLSVAVVEPSVHCRVLVGQVEGMRVPEEDALRRGGGPHARGEVDVRLGLLRAADLGVVEEPTRQLGAVPDAGERLLHLAPADAAPARREVGRLADLTVLLPPGAGPGAERRVVDLRDGAEEQV